MQHERTVLACLLALPVAGLLGVLHVCWLAWLNNHALNPQKLSSLAGQRRPVPHNTLKALPSPGRGFGAVCTSLHHRARLSCSSKALCAALTYLGNVSVPDLLHPKVCFVVLDGVIQVAHPEDGVQHPLVILHHCSP